MWSLLQIYQNETELLLSARDHIDGDIGFNLENRSLYVFVAGSWMKQACGCDNLRSGKEVEVPGQWDVLKNDWTGLNRLSIGMKQNNTTM